MDPGKETFIFHLRLCHPHTMDNEKVKNFLYCIINKTFLSFLRQQFSVVESKTQKYGKQKIELTLGWTMLEQILLELKSGAMGKIETNFLSFQKELGKS